ncbi:hypothetical protein N2384_07940 [Bacillus paralicheniformis]|uniref:hypothetical protein n=1 Tax=Bacillus paralicheniformis TaxID=1648923 RepID=UPI0021A75910|nr:hypothetical protein [Bacillus paralicheniformis]UWS64427.1 hypothetical protein N2384_07940 [Bacillus paralicheniformis]
MPQIISYIRKLKDVKYIFPEVNTIFERNPYPVGILPRNPVHDVVYGTGTMHAILPSYLESGLDQRREPSLSEADHHCLFHRSPPFLSVLFLSSPIMDMTEKV